MINPITSLSKPREKAREALGIEREDRYITGGSEVHSGTSLDRHGNWESITA